MITVYIRKHPTKGCQHILKVNGCDLFRIRYTQVSQGLDAICDVICDVIVGFPDSPRFENGKIIMPNGDSAPCQLFELARYPHYNHSIYDIHVAKFACKATLE